MLIRSPAASVMSRIMLSPVSTLKIFGLTTVPVALMLICTPVSRSPSFLIDFSVFAMISEKGIPAASIENGNSNKFSMLDISCTSAMTSLKLGCGQKIVICATCLMSKNEIATTRVYPSM